MTDAEPTQVIRGQAYYLERIMLPLGITQRAQLVDKRLADAQGRRAEPQE